MVYFFTIDLGSPHQLFTRLLDTLRFSSDKAIRLLTEYSNFFHINFLALALAAVNASVGGLVLTEDSILPIVCISSCTALIAMQDNMIISALVGGSCYEVLASCLFEAIPWSWASYMVNSSGEINGMQNFVRIMGALQAPGDNSFSVSSLNIFISSLKDRTNSGDKILLNDAYLLVTLLSDTLKQFIEDGIHLIFENQIDLEKVTQLAE